jgi:hypothetical protein
VSVKLGDGEAAVKVSKDQLIEDNKGNILGIKLKTIFDNPQEYAEHYRAGYEKFAKKEDFSLPSVGRLNKLKKAVGLPVPQGARADDMDDAYTQAWLEIHGPIPPDLMNVPDEIQLAIRGLYEDRPAQEMTAKEKLEDAKTVMQGMKWDGRNLPKYRGFEGGVNPKYVDAMWQNMKSTGDAIRRDISGALKRGKSIEQVHMCQKAFWSLLRSSSLHRHRTTAKSRMTGMISRCPKVSILCTISQLARLVPVTC